MTIHLGLNFLCVILAFGLVMALLLMAAKSDKRPQRRWNFITITVIIVGLGLTWFGAFQVIRWIAEVLR